MTDGSSAGPDFNVIARPTGQGRFQTEVQLRGGPVVADEPVEAGGLGGGPTPYELLSGALAACTAMTLRLYAERKGWTLPPFSVAAAHSIVPAGADGMPPRDLFTRNIAFEAPLDPERSGKLLAVADKCPVHRTLMRGFEIKTEIGTALAPLTPEEPTRHERDMEWACND
ncbi:MAG TPA: OsmC family protein [Allosphingosinicella sp.]|nr:OsmC family protein [Allosphingosinicella sp.]